MLKINCDIGERGADHPDDLELTRHIDIANIACGGHAGDAESIAVFRSLAEELGVKISAHLSYPDREGFGRRSMDIGPDALLASLDEQMARLPGIFAVKFHGALYNDSVKDAGLAELLSDWLIRHSIRTLIAPADSEMARAAQKRGIRILGEAFADRRYALDAQGRLGLLSRTHPDAVFDALDDALQQCRKFAEGRVAARTDDGSEREVAIRADTLCIHSDSDISMPLIQALRHSTPPFEFIDKGLGWLVSAPAYGRQSLGVTPGGPQDRFSFETGRALLESDSRQSLEFVIPPVLRVTRAALFVLTGARFKDVRIERRDQVLPVTHAKVFHAESGDVLRFGENVAGLRGYLSWRLAAESINDLTGRMRPPLTELVDWHEPRRQIRVVPGPEFDWLENAELLISRPWKIGLKSGAMGIHLESDGVPLKIRDENMISAPVSDGTVQFTPNGPIVLMRQRQTIGGYPRVASVIEVDLDRLAQFRPGEVIRFTWTDIETARGLLDRRNAALRKLRVQ